MELTFIGLALLVVGTLIVLAGGVRSAVAFLVLCAMFDGSAAIALPALGGSTIPPVQFALAFVLLRIFAPRGGYFSFLPAAINENKWIILFAIYGIVMSYVGPRLFGGAIDVFPMRPDPTMGLFDTVPLVPTAQNFTAAFYLVGTFLLAIASYIFCRTRGGAEALITALLIASWLHILTGVMDLLTRGTPFEVILSMFRNGGYSALDLSISGFIRIRGVLPEASSYAGIGFAVFVANAEMWYHSIRPRATGIVAAILAVILVISTASTAYVALAAYVFFFGLRAMAFPSAAPRGKIMTAVVVACLIVFGLSIMMALVPRLPFAIYELILEMTFGKPTSVSGQQRLFWAMQGWHAFLASYGLGIGPGSFRSSSMLAAILGSMGVVGVLTFLLYLKVVFRPSARSTWGIGPTFASSLGGALGTAALVSLVPAAVASPNVIPGALFSIMAGAAVGLRTRTITLESGETMPRGHFRWQSPKPVNESAAS